MKNIKHFAQRYVDWVIRLGRIRFSLLGVTILAIFALCTQILFSFFIVHTISWGDIIRSVTFGLLTAPFVIYFFTLLVERLERSRLELSCSVNRLEKEVNERIIAQQKLSDALEKLEKHNRDKSTLLATISHELRTPLNGIVGLSQILLDDKLDDKQRNYLKTINISAVSLGYIFSDIIDLEKIDASRIELNLQPTDFPALLNDIYNFASFLAKQKHLTFHLVTEPGLPNYLTLDRVRLSQILWNLISNAVKFTDHGEITLKVSREKDYYYFNVIDTGMGIAPKEQSRIFELYYQVKESRQQSAGSGIGLAISKNLARLMRGDLRVESELGKGSTFYLSIQAEETQINTINHQVIPHLHILLVEDVELNVIVAKTILEKLGHRVDVAINGQQAIALFEKNSYDLLLLDIKLPDMTGFDIAQYLRKNYEEGIYDFLPPMIAFTANVMHSEKDYLEMGMDGVLRKPILIKDLQHCLQYFFSDESHPILKIQENDNTEVFDLDLIETLGKAQVLANLDIFKQVMPTYLSKLSVNNLKETESFSHKIKGAAASVGLIQLHKLAEDLEKAAQVSNKIIIEKWIELMNKNWKDEVDSLIQFLNYKR